MSSKCLIYKLTCHVLKRISSLHDSCYETFTGRGLWNNPNDLFVAITASTNSLLQFCEVENAYFPLASYTLTNVSPYISNIARSTHHPS